MNLIFVILGFIFVALGCIGIVLPVLPTVPFFLLASFCFSKGSKRFHMWFQNTKIYKRHLAAFEENRAMTLATKVKVLSFATAMMAISFFIVPKWYVKLILLILTAIMYLYFIFRIKTIKKTD